MRSKFIPKTQYSKGYHRAPLISWTRKGWEEEKEKEVRAVSMQKNTDPEIIYGYHADWETGELIQFSELFPVGSEKFFDSFSTDGTETHRFVRSELNILQWTCILKHYKDEPVIKERFRGLKERQELDINNLAVYEAAGVVDYYCKKQWIEAKDYFEIHRGRETTKDIFLQTLKTFTE